MNEVILQVDHVVKTFGGSRAVDDVSFSVRRGEVLGLVGESGSGKSTTARCITGLLKPDSGSVLVEGYEVVNARANVLRRAQSVMQMVFQDPYSSLNPRMTVEQLVGEGLIVHGIEPKAAARRARVTELLEMVGLAPEQLGRYPRSFSGGQRQRIAIARALAVSPQLLICDEPVSSLDVSVQAQVLNLFRELRERLDLSILFIAHDLGVVHYLCDRVAVMQHGQIVEIGDREQVYGRPAHPYTRSLLEAVPIPDPQLERRRRASSANENT